jgi:large subunit ribosomal protein L4
VSAVKIKVRDIKGAEVGELELDSRVFAAEVNPGLVQQVVRWQRAKARAGTHSSLTKGMMKGGNRKPWKQKGTGMARSGSNTSPLWVGGAKAHGPQPRSYEFSFNKKARRKALCAVLSDKVNSDLIVIVDDCAKLSGKTKEMTKVIADLGISPRKKIAVVHEKKDVNLLRAARNIARTTTLSLDAINVYDLVRCPVLFSTAAALKQLEKNLIGEKA